MILPARPGCVRVIVRDIEGVPIGNAIVNLYAVIVLGQTGEQIASGITDSKGMIMFCDVFKPNTNYAIIVIDQQGNELWSGVFTTNKKSTAEVPVIVMLKDEETIDIETKIKRYINRRGYMD